MLFLILGKCGETAQSNVTVQHSPAVRSFSDKYLTARLCASPAVEESDIIDLEKRYWLLKAQSRTGRFDLETFVPLVSPPIHASLSEGKTILAQFHICIALQ